MSFLQKRKPQTLLSFGFTKNISRPSNASDSSYEPPRDVSPLEASSIPACIPAEPATNMLATMNASEAVTNKNKYISSQEVSLIDIFLGAIGDECKSFFDTFVQSSEYLLLALLALARTYSSVDDLLKKYVAGQTNNRNSKLSQTLNFYEIRKELKDQIIAAVNIKLEPALGLHILQINAEEKENLHKTIGLKCYTFKSSIEEWY